MGGNPRGGPRLAGGGPAAPGSTVTTVTTGSYTGTSGRDAIYLGGSGSTVTVSATEWLMGGAGTDVVTLGDAGSTMMVTGVETLIGGAGTDVISLGAYGATLAVSGVETLLGSGGSDVVTVTSGTVVYGMRGDTTALTLAADNGADQVVLADGGFGFGRAFANTATYNQISNFQSGTDTFVLTGQMERRVDDDADGVVDGASVGTGALDVSTTEVAALTATVASLTDTDFTSVRSAIGSLVNSSSRADVVVLASDGTSTGAYMVTDVNGDGTVAATEIKLLGVFNNSTVAVTDILYG